MNTTSPFTKADGLHMQQEHLEEWKPRLASACYESLCEFVRIRNSQLSENATGYDVFRGHDFLNVILNWKPAPQAPRSTGDQKPVLSEAFNIISDLRARFAFYKIGQSDESSEVPGAIVVDSKILNALKVIVEAADDAPRILCSLLCLDDSLACVGVAPMNVIDTPRNRIVLRARQFLGDINNEPYAMPKLHPAPPKITTRSIETNKRSYRYLEQLCWLRGIVCERNVNGVSLTTPDGGTTADCDTISDGLETLRTDPTFGSLPNREDRALV